MIKITNQTNLKFQMITDNLQVGILKCRIDKYLTIEEMNSGFIQLSGYSAEDMDTLFKNHLIKCVHPDDIPVLDNLQKDISDGKICAAAEFRIPGKNKASRWYRLLVLTQFNEFRKPYGVVGILFDIDGEMQFMNELRFQAEQDSLTGLYNRKETESRIKEHLDGKPEKQCALYMIDADNFKQVNDTKGHMMGDVVLTEIASAMKSLMRPTDIVGRIGGDEFTVFMKDISSKNAAQKKADQLSNVFRRLFENEKLSLQITCSIGVAVYPEDGTDFKTLYKHADQALYQAKTHGKNNYVMYDSNHVYYPEETDCSSIGAHIDSESRPAQSQGDLLADVFKILYRMENHDQAINLILEIIGKKFDVSRSYIFESTEDGKYTSNTYEWCNDGILPQIDQLQNLNYNQFGDYSTLFQESSIFYCRDVNTLHPKQKEILGEQGIRSTLQCAFWRGDSLAGFIGFDECTGLRLWTKEEVDILSLISQMMSVFLQKRRMTEWNNRISKEIISEKTHLLQDLTDAILNREYLVYLQPEINLDSGRIDSAEVLVRHREKDGSISLPHKFIPMLESKGLISKIDFFVLEEVCKMLSDWKYTEFSDIRLTLNFSSITLSDDQFFTRFMDIFSRYDLNPDQIEIEITETQETLKKEQMVLLLELLKSHGFRIVLDHFGVEYSSYQFLLMASFDLLKIDKSIVHKYEASTKGKILMKHIVQMCHDMGIKCCAVGAESLTQYRFIKEIGCDYIQGYLTEKPVPPEEFKLCCSFDYRMLYL